MDWLTFFASVIESLAWPLAIVLLVVVLREPIKALVPLLQRFKYKELELEFGRRVEEIKEEVARELPIEAAAPLLTDESLALARLAEVSPRSAVLEAWRGVEHAALEKARAIGGTSFRDKTLTYNAIRLLEHDGALDRKMISILRDLRGLRNEAAHSRDFAPTKETALDYAASAVAIAGYLGVALAVAPTYPSPLTVGQGDVPAQLMITNGSSGRVSLTQIRHVPACGCDDIPCRSGKEDPEVFVVKGKLPGNKAAGRAGTAFAGMTFTIGHADARTGEIEFIADQSPALLEPANSPLQVGVIDFLIDVKALPKNDADERLPGIQTNQLGVVVGQSTETRLSGTGTGSNQTTVLPADSPPGWAQGGSAP